MRILASNGSVMLVYDILETEGKESPAEFLQRSLGRKPFDIQGKLDEKIFNHAMNEAKKWRIKISCKPLSYLNAGHVTTIFKGYLEICLKEGMSNEANMAVLIHELAHLFLGHTGHKQLHYLGKEKPIKLLQRKLSRRRKNWKQKQKLLDLQETWLAE